MKICNRMILFIVCVMDKMATEGLSFPFIVSPAEGVLMTCMMMCDYACRK